MKQVVLGTAGHIDHGKSTLVKALTSIDPDRLKEEKERGMTIDLGFAFLNLEPDVRVGIVDVPGHERFIRNMLAGAGGIDLVLLVVDANEGIMPQTREHLDIVNLLGIPKGVVAITKIDLAEPEMVELVESEVRDVVAGTCLEAAPIIRVSAVTGQGLDELKGVLRRLALESAAHDADSVFRLPVDRVFTMKGHGTVVTGTAFSGRVAVGDAVEILPSGLTARVREIQNHNEVCQESLPGSRAALNLVGLAKGQIERGDTVVTPGALRATDCIDCRVQLIPRASRPLKNRSRLKLHLTTAQTMATLVLLEGSHLAPCRTALAQLRLDHQLLALPRDRFVIRGGSPETTLGGGHVIDSLPEPRRRASQPLLQLLRNMETGSDAQRATMLLACSAGSVPAATLAARMGLPRTRLSRLIEPSVQSEEILRFESGAEEVYVHRDVFQRLVEKATSEVVEYFRKNFYRLGMPLEELREKLDRQHVIGIIDAITRHLQESGTFELREAKIRLKGREIELRPQQKAIISAMEELFQSARFSPPREKELAELLHCDEREASRMFMLLVEEGKLFRISSEVTMHSAAVKDAISKVHSFLASHPQMEVGDLKELLGCSRKYAIAMMEYLDRSGVTVRVGDARVLRPK